MNKIIIIIKIIIRCNKIATMISKMILEKKGKVNHEIKTHVLCVCLFVLFFHILNNKYSVFNNKTNMHNTGEQLLT